MSIESAPLQSSPVGEPPVERATLRRTGAARHRKPPPRGKAARPPKLYIKSPGRWLRSEPALTTKPETAEALGEPDAAIAGVQPRELTLPVQYSARSHSSGTPLPLASSELPLAIWRGS